MADQTSRVAVSADEISARLRMSGRSDGRASAADVAFVRSRRTRASMWCRRR